eukprot:TRINITY_DN4153_c0_g2_i6.p9 TRINITY_DN4153_c0_g2~~TRINITY_DN4153_c0_g2_i6.p9  ORF type:complete len:126 (+),score=1.73 TRINITY_DN4153_c0_g2_i6:823-1200(+)
MFIYGFKQRINLNKFMFIGFKNVAKYIQIKKGQNICLLVHITQILTNNITNYQLVLIDYKQQKNLQINKLLCFRYLSAKIRNQELSQLIIKIRNVRSKKYFPISKIIQLGITLIWDLNEDLFLDL